jgi:hypothetical protein
MIGAWPQSHGGSSTARSPIPRGLDRRTSAATGTPPCIRVAPRRSGARRRTGGVGGGGRPPARDPANRDVGGHHLACYVDDLEVAVAYLREASGVAVRATRRRSSRRSLTRARASSRAGRRAGCRWSSQPATAWPYKQTPTSGRSGRPSLGTARRPKEADRQAQWGAPEGRLIPSDADAEGGRRAVRGRSPIRSARRTKRSRVDLTGHVRALGAILEVVDEKGMNDAVSSQRIPDR